MSFDRRRHDWLSGAAMLLAGTAASTGASAQTAPMGMPTPATRPAADATAADARADTGGDASPTSPGAPSDSSDIVVSGTRLKYNGAKAPTPETVISAADIAAKAPVNIADYVNTLPQLAGSATPRQRTTDLAGGTSGSNFLNLRGLGTNRTLVLLDGRRVVGSSVDQRVDVNTLPTALISRVDVVTGGASAAYGSDAVAGVVNFVLNTRFTGLQLEAQNGISTYGDDRKYRIAGAWGANFGGDRGHVIASLSYTDTAGVARTDSRPWYRGTAIIPNPAFAAGNGQPRLIQRDDVNIGNASEAGLITSGVLAGTQFGENGAFRPRVFGTAAGMYSIGGETQNFQRIYALEAPSHQLTGFGRISYEVADGIELYGEFNYGRAVATPLSIPNFAFGNITVRADNAFLDPALAARLAAAGQTSFQFGTFNPDIGRIRSRQERTVTRYVGGVKGEFGQGWSFEASGVYGRTRSSTQVFNLQNKANYALAIDAVRNPATRAIVCRSTLTDPGNGCVPYNLFGSGVNGPAAIGYATGVGRLDLTLQEAVFAGTIQGSPLSTWAGPVSVVVGAEYRDERVRGAADAISRANGFFAGNYKPTNGDYNVKEAFAETIVPLARDLPFAYSLDLNAAYRYTDYSVSGGIGSWKVGATYNPIRDLRLRATRSRDIRAPNLNDLFQGGAVTIQQTVLDRGVTTTGITSTVVGNMAVSPEKADTLTAGFVYSPAWLDGLSVSVDYYRIKIRDAILTPSLQSLVNQCNGGNTALCAGITRNAAGQITAATLTPFNLASERLRGLDIEASYSRAVAADTRLTARALASHVILHDLTDGITVDRLDGENAVPPAGSTARWRLIASLGVQHGPVSAVLTGRYTSGGVFDRAYTATDLADNRIAGATYYDLATSVKVPAFGKDAELFFNVDNLLNKAPVIIPSIIQPFVFSPVNSLLYDTIGREFKAGVKVRL